MNVIDNMPDIYLNIGTFLIGFLFIGVLIFYMFHNHKIRKNLKQTIENGESIEKIKVLKSKNKTTANNYMKKEGKIGLFCILGLCLIAAISIFVYMTNNMNMYIYTIIVSFVLMCIILNYVIKKNDKDFISYMKKLFDVKYGNVIFYDDFENKIIDNDLDCDEEVSDNNVRKVYILCCETLKYNAVVSNYKLEFNIPDEYGDHYQAYKNIFEYVYSINNAEQLRENVNYKTAVEYLKNEKYVDVFVTKDKLIIKKETVLLGYLKEDADNDINDVELFYKKLVENIK